MNNAPKILIPALTLFALLSVSLLYSGIARLRRTDTPPFGGGLYTVASGIQRPSDALLLRLDSKFLRWSLWTLTLVLPAVAAVLCFAKDRALLGSALLLIWSGLTGFFGLWIWLYSAFHALST